MVWAVMMAVQVEFQMVVNYLPFLVGLLMVAGVSFSDDVKSLPDSVRLIVQFVAMALMFWSMNLFSVMSYELIPLWLMTALVNNIIYIRNFGELFVSLQKERRIRL